MGCSPVLLDALQQIKKPLDYCARNAYANIERVRSLEHTVTAWAERLTPETLSAFQLDQIRQFRALFLRYDAHPTSEKIRIVRSALTLLTDLESSASAPSAPRSSPSGEREELAVVVERKANLSRLHPDSAPQPEHQERSAPGISDVITPSPIDNLATPIQFVKGVGPKRARLLNRMGIQTVQDALFLFPRRYEDRRQIAKISRLRPGDAFTTVYGVVKLGDITTTSKQRKKIFELIVGDDTGTLSAKWFNQPFLKKIFKPDMPVVLSGKITMNRYGGVEMIQPEYEILDQAEPDEELLHTGRIVPIYPLTEGLYQKEMRRLMKSVVDQYAALVEEDLPEDIRERHQLWALPNALRRLHFPDNDDDVSLLNRETSLAHQRLIFEEFFLLELGMGLKRQHVMTHETGIAFQFDGVLERRLRAALPFPLTNAQNRVILQIQDDMRSVKPMNRLLQGDVGSGKTIVALIAILSAIEAGYQGAIMVPTEILAEQHYRKTVAYLEQLNAGFAQQTADAPETLTLPGQSGLFPCINVCLLTGGMKKKEREEALLRIQRGDIHLVIGTHALIQHDVSFHHLGLIVIDEQHKFGVMQRASLKAKGYQPDVLIMTATPIPRTLSLTVYGDLEVAILDELPPGRTPVITKRFYEQNREMAYRLISQEIERRQQVYIVYPLVEESEHVDLKAATEMSEHLARDIFPQYRVGLVHGRLKPEEKDRQMQAFKHHDLDILVSTTVLEVGIDVPNATVMLIEHAERFGLSQLHQLRGRVGRGSAKSYCLLMTAYPISNEARRRLDAMVETTDGFVIAERDLEIRGPGEFFGTKQSGLPDLKVANLIRDVKLLEQARMEAFTLLQHDPDLKLPQHRAIKSALEQRWKKSLDLISIG